MPLTKPSQDLKRYLQGIASDLKWSAVELKRIADGLSQAGNEGDAQPSCGWLRSFVVVRGDWCAIRRRFRVGE